MIPPQFDMALEFCEGMGPVRRGKLNGFVNHNGELVIDTIYGNVGRFSGGIAKVDIRTDENYAKVNPFEAVGFIGISGSLVISPAYFSAGTFHRGLCLVETEKHVGYIDRAGEMIWRSGLVELGSFDPHHLLPPETNGVRATSGQASNSRGAK